MAVVAVVLSGISAMACIAIAWIEYCNFCIIREIAGKQKAKRFKDREYI